MSIILTVLLIILAVRISGFMLKITGRILGGVLGFIGFMMIAGIAVSILSLTIKLVPVILVIGVIAIACKTGKNESRDRLNDRMV